jgi:hypothetical protein
VNQERMRILRGEVTVRDALGDLMGRPRMRE